MLFRVKDKWLVDVHNPIIIFTRVVQGRGGLQI